MIEIKKDKEIKRNQWKDTSGSLLQDSPNTQLLLFFSHTFSNCSSCFNLKCWWSFIHFNCFPFSFLWLLLRWPWGSWHAPVCLPTWLFYIFKLLILSSQHFIRMENGNKNQFCWCFNQLPVCAVYATQPIVRADYPEKCLWRQFGLIPLCLEICEEHPRRICAAFIR